MKNTKKLVALLLAATMAVGLTACGSKETETSTATEAVSGTEEGAAAAPATEMAEKVTIAVDDDSFTLGPWGDESGVRNYTLYALWGVLAYRPFTGAMLENGEMELVMAKSVEKVDDSTYSVEIYDNITDSQGNNITAADVVFSLDSLKEMGFNNYVSSYYGSSSATGDYTVEIKLSSPTEGAIEEILDGGTICSQAWYESASADELLSSPATTGPYILTDYQAGSSASLEARDYWKTEDLTTVENQNVKTIDIVCITEASMRTIALENGEVDLAEVSASDVSRFESDSEYMVTKYLNDMNDFLVFNTSDVSPCKDLNVRQAIAYAFDAWEVFLGHGHDQGVLNHDVCPNLTPDYQDEWDEEPYYEMDLDKTKELLAAAGYSESNPLKIKLIYNAVSPQGPNVALQGMLIEAGIDCELITCDRALFMDNHKKPETWDIYIFSDAVKDFTTTFWTSLFDDANYGDQGTRSFTVDPKLQELLDAACADRSAENMNAFHDYNTEMCYILGLYGETKSIVSQAGVTDICLQNGIPILQSMTYSADYTPVD